MDRSVKAPRKRWLILIAAVCMQMCLGATYSWSVFVQPLKEATGLLQGTVQLPFSVFYFVFPATMLVSGKVLNRFGPRACAMAGGLLFGAGWILAGFGRRHFLLAVGGVGCLSGMGAGLAYIVPIATCIRWFPTQKGLVTGVAVAGFGGGAALVSQVAGRLIAQQGFTPFEALGLFGFIFLVLVSLAGVFMENPSDVSDRRPVSLLMRDVLREPVFKVLYLAMFAGLAAGFAVNANMKELYRGGGVEAGIMAVSLFAVANAVGRVSWGFLFDRMNVSDGIRVNLLLQAALLLASPWVLRSAAGLQIFAFCSGFNYGGVLVLYASSAAHIWGVDKVGQTYGWLFSANIPAALSPIAAGYVYDATGTFSPPLVGLGVLVLAAVIIVTRKRVHLTG